MALQKFAGADFADGACFIAGFYDDVSLIMKIVRSQNLTDKPCGMTVHGPSNFHQTFPLAAQTSLRDTDVSALNIQMVRSIASNPKTGTQTVVDLPVGWSLTFNYG